jgi:hypothetical protein
MVTAECAGSDRPSAANAISPALIVVFLVFMQFGFIWIGGLIVVGRRFMAR